MCGIELQIVRDEVEQRGRIDRVASPGANSTPGCDAVTERRRVRKRCPIALRQPTPAAAIRLQTTRAQFVPLIGTAARCIRQDWSCWA